MKTEEDKTNDNARATLRWICEGAVVFSMGMYVCFVLFKPTDSSSLESIFVRIGTVVALAFGIYRIHPSNTAKRDTETAREVARGMSLAVWMVWAAILLLFCVLGIAVTYRQTGDAFRIGFVVIVSLLALSTYPRKTGDKGVEKRID